MAEFLGQRSVGRELVARTLYPPVDAAPQVVYCLVGAAEPEYCFTDTLKDVGSGRIPFLRCADTSAWAQSVVRQVSLG